MSLKQRVRMARYGRTSMTLISTQHDREAIKRVNLTDKASVWTK